MEDGGCYILNILKKQGEGWRSELNKDVCRWGELLHLLH